MVVQKTCLSAEEVAERLGLSISMVRKLTRNGAIPHFKAGRRILYPLELLDRWILNCTQSEINEKRLTQ